MRGQKPAKRPCRASDYTIRIMLSLLRRWGAKAFPSNSRARQRQAGSPLQGPPGTRPVRGLRTLRSFVSASVPIPPALHPLSAQPPATSALRLVSRIGGVRGRKVPPRRAVVQRAQHLPHSASVQCEHPAALGSSAAGSARHQKPAVRQAGQLAFEAVPPRYGFAVVIPGRNSSRPCVIFALRAVLACVPHRCGPHRCGPSSAKKPLSLPGVQDTAVPAVGADKVRVNRP